MLLFSFIAKIYLQNFNKEKNMNNSGNWVKNGILFVVTITVFFVMSGSGLANI